MNPILTTCPVCREQLEVSKLYCRYCDTGIEGHFNLDRFFNLTPEQLRFAETFIQCEGKINRVGEVLNISYPTVRTRLHDLMRGMGFDIKDDDEDLKTHANRQAVLEELAKGSITAEEAIAKLEE